MCMSTVDWNNSALILAPPSPSPSNKAGWAFTVNCSGIIIIIIIIIINFYCPVSNTRYHSIGLKVKEKQESNPGRQSDDRMGENSRGKADLKRWVLSFERNVETDNELRVSGGREFQSLGAMTEKALLPRDVRTYGYGMDRTDESDDLVDRE